MASRAALGKEDMARLSERRGEPGIARPDGPLAWLHAASVGEALSALPLIRRLAQEFPALHVLVTTGTVTSAEMLANRLPPRTLHQFVPVDRPAWTRRFLDHWRPDLAVWLESELWPNLLLQTRARGTAMALVNARLSARSHRRWRRAREVSSRLLSAFDIVLAQDQEIASRLSDLGAGNVAVIGTLKYADDPLPYDRGMLNAIADASAGRPCWLAASIHPGEEEAAFAAHREVARAHPRLLTIIVPRHVRRADAFCRAAEGHGLRVARRSVRELPDADTDIYIADTMGELGLFYRFAPVCFVGGSLVAHGGQNVLEPARLDCAITHGPHMQNFAEIAAEFRSAAAATEVNDAPTLATIVAALLDDPEKRGAMCRAARRVAGGKREILDYVVTRLRPLLPADVTAAAAEASLHARA